MTAIVESEPSLWWIGAEELSTLHPPPLVLGVLDASSLDPFNPRERDLLVSLGNTIILRAYTNHGMSTQALTELLPRAFSINGEFLPTDLSFQREREGCSVSFYQPSSNLSQRGMDVLRALQEEALTAEAADELKLDLILEDYLDQAACVASHLPRRKAILPTVNIASILRMSASRRLDLCVLLTASIIVYIPRTVLMETMLVLFFEHFNEKQASDLLDLEDCLKTALVSVIHRNLRKEVEPFVTMKKSGDERVESGYPRKGGFPYRQLEPFFAFMHSPLAQSADVRGFGGDTLTQEQQSLLNKLPSSPTKLFFLNAISVEGKAPYDSWVSLVCRHAVFLLMKASTCPSLVHPQICLMDQKHYNELQHLLSLAALTYEDMNVIARDGRSKMVLDFGQGIPNGKPSKLFWRKKEWAESRSRLYIDSFSDETPRSSSVGQLPAEAPESPELQSKQARLLRHRDFRHSYSSRPIPNVVVKIPLSESISYADEAYSPYLRELIEQQRHVQLSSPVTETVEKEDSPQSRNHLPPCIFSIQDPFPVAEDHSRQLCKPMSRLGSYKAFRKKLRLLQEVPLISSNRMRFSNGTLPLSYFAFIQLCCS